MGVAKGLVCEQIGDALDAPGRIRRRRTLSLSRSFPHAGTRNRGRHEWLSAPSWRSEGREMRVMSPRSVVCARKEMARRLSAEMEGQAHSLEEAAERLAGPLQTGRVRRRSAWLCRPGASVAASAAVLVSVGKEGVPSW